LFDETLHIGSYRLEEKLGEGGMGVVYRAIDEQLNREVAVKILHPGMLKQDSQIERFRREARMQAKMIHPNIVTLLSLYEDDGQMALVMEMVHGQNLKEYLHQNPRPTLPDVIRIAEAVCAALTVAHKFGMVHRDIKPANILLATDGSIKLMDFGLAKPQYDDADLTQSGIAVGSYRYMAPEQILNKPIDARTDMYALGILMYQMTTGKFPFTASIEGGGEFEIMEKQVRHTPESPHKWNSALPPLMSDMIMALLAKNPDQRPADCKEVRNILATISRQIQHPQESVGYSHHPNTLNNVEIAKGLIYSWNRHTLRFLKRGMSSIRYYLLDIPTRWFNDNMPIFRHQITGTKQVRYIWIRTLTFLKQSGLCIRRYILDIPTRWFHTNVSPFLAERLNISKRFQAVCVWGLILLLLGGGAALINLRQTSEHISIVPDISLSHSAIQQPISVMPEKKSAHLLKKKQVKIIAPVKPAVPAPPTHVSKISPTPVKSITYRVANRLVRSDGSRVNGGKHEFRGGRHLYFPQLADYPLKSTFHSVKSGWVRLYLTKSVKLSSILIHRASVGKRSFKHGEIKLEVQNSRGHWQTLLLRKDRDIDWLLRISQPKSMLADVKGVRLKFKTPEPMTIGPIDLLP